MKFLHKCGHCHRETHKKYRGLFLCERCSKQLKQRDRRRKARAIIGEKIAFSLGTIPVYRSVVIKIPA